MNLKITITLTIMIAMLILIALYIQTNSDNVNSDNKSFKSFKISIITNSTNNYTIYMPIAYVNISKPSRIMSTISDEFIDQIETDYGNALKIENSGNFSISLTLNQFESGELHFSLREIIEINNKPTLFVWIYYNGTKSISLSLEVYSEINEDNIISMEREWGENIYISNNGWNQIKLEVEANVD